MRKVYLFGEINNERAEKFIAQLHELFELSSEPVMIYINSCGGSVTDALAIYDVLRAAPCTIHLIGLGKVHSSALTILLAADREHRASYPNTEFMSHDISWKSDGPRAFLKDRVDQLERTVKQLLRIYTRDTEVSETQARQMFFTDMADHYFSAEEAMEMAEDLAWPTLALVFTQCRLQLLTGRSIDLAIVRQASSRRLGSHPNR